MHNVKKLLVTTRFLLGALGLAVGLCFLLFAAWRGAEHSVLSMFVRDVGAILITCSLLHLAYEMYLQRLHEQEVMDALRRIIDEEYKDLKTLRDIGFIKAFSSLQDFYGDAMGKAKKIHVAKTWFPEDLGIRKPLQDALDRPGVEVRLTLCDPYSKILEDRCLSAGVPRDEGKHWVKAAVAQIHDAVRRNQNAGVVLHDGWPGVPIIMTTEFGANNREINRLFMGFYLQTASPQGPWIEVDVSTDFGKTLISQFDSLAKRVTKAVSKSQHNDGKRSQSEEIPALTEEAHFVELYANWEWEKKARPFLTRPRDER